MLYQRPITPRTRLLSKPADKDRGKTAAEKIGHFRILPLPFQKRSQVRLPELKVSAPVRGLSQLHRLKIQLGRKCETCRHPQRAAIDLEIIAGCSKRELAERYRLSPSSVQRHRDHCVPGDLIQAQLSKKIDRSDFLAAHSCALEREAAAIGDDARKAGNLTTALDSVAERRRILALQSGLAMSDNSSAKTSAGSEWERVKKKIIDALAPHPEARVAVAEALDSSRVRQ